MNARSLTYIDLFAGAGGLSQGFKEASDRFEHVLGVEMDRAAAATYRANHGDVFNGDIAFWLQSELPDADVMLGGPPCQGFSMLGKQDPDDPRNRLWESYLRAIRRIRPMYFVMENVAAFANSTAFQAMMRDLEHSTSLQGVYKLDARVLNAADYDTAQSRKRVIIIGSRYDVAAMNFPDPSLEVRDVRSVIGSLPVPATATWPQRQVDERLGAAGPYLTSEIHIDRNYELISQRRFRAIPAGGNRFNLPDELKAPCWLKHRSGSGDVMGRLHWDRPSVTIRTEFFKPEKGRYLHPEQHRAITHREAALIQGFPEDYKWYGTRTEVARQIGNAVPVPLARALGKAVLKAADSRRPIVHPSVQGQTEGAA